MALASQYPGHIVIAEDPQNIIFGTCQVGDDFGEVQSASVKRTADKEELDNCHGSLLAAILRKPRFELSLTTLFEADVTPPGIGERIAFPLVNVHGRILDVTVNWESAQGRELTIEATSWDSFAGNEVAEAFDGAGWTGVADTVEVTPVTPLTPPALVSAVIPAAGTTLVLTFTQAVTTPLIGSDLGITVNATPYTPVYSAGNATSILTFNLPLTVEDGDTVLLNYAQPGNGIQNLSGVDLASISGGAVTNNSTQS